MKQPLTIEPRGAWRTSDAPAMRRLARVLSSYRLRLLGLDFGLVSLFMFGLYSIWSPGQELTNLLKSIFSAAVYALVGHAGSIFFRRPDDSSGQNWRLLREMLVPAVQVEQADSVLLRSLTADLRHKFNLRRKHLAGPAIFSLLLLALAQPDLMRGLAQVSGAFALWRPEATLRVIKGHPDQGDSLKPVEVPVYRHRAPNIELLEGNLVEVFVQRPLNSAPVIELPQLSQRFAMAPNANESDASVFSLTLTIAKSSDIYLSDNGGRVHLASVKVFTMPVPEVALSSPVVQGGVSSGNEVFDGAWLDDKPLPLLIDVHGEASIASIKLLIKSGNLEFTENVLNVMSDDKRDVQTNYQVTLESYIESDEAEVSLVAIATDRAVPVPLTGFSEPLRISVLSAYGRYRRSLETLKKLKELVDDRGSKSEMSELMAKALKQSLESPYFDALDRNDLLAFKSALQEDNELVMIDLSAGLGEFLFQHESIDQRERDRDFFVAMRTMSRVLQRPDSARGSALQSMTPRLKSFLDERHLFWTKRVELLGRGATPLGWVKIRDQKPFHQLISDIAKQMLAEDVSSRNQNARELLGKIAASVGQYRQWIDELEAKEDEQRRRREAEQQKGVASITGELRELQRRQNEISSGLDRATSRQLEELAGRWPGLRASQNSNLKGTRSLEGKIRAFAPGAEGRFKAAVEMMEKTVVSGNDGKFSVAETSSDRAGRLLRQTEQAAKRAASGSQSRGRRRRISGDSYYGQSIVGGDVEIKRDYQVDRRYREDILEEVARSRAEDDDRVLLDRYTREIVR